jgi:hypothetical protein
MRGWALVAHFIYKILKSYPATVKRSGVALNNAVGK